MSRVIDIYNFLCELAPLELQLGFDNSGFQLGHDDAELTHALLALDITYDVVEEAIEKKCNLIISHHPLIFNGIKRITDKKLLKLVENHISVISMHTNLDIAQGGVNDVLIDILGAKVDSVLDSDGCGRVGYLKQETSLESFLLRCKEILNSNGLRFYDAGKTVHRLAVMGGAGGDFVEDAYNKGCDTYLTSDIKYHQFLLAQELGINLVDADHFCTENPIIAVLADKLRAKFKNIDFEISNIHRQIVSFR